MKIELKSKEGYLDLTLLEVDEDPSENKWFHLNARAESNGFSGVSNFWIGPGKFRLFLTDLETFDKLLKGNPKLVCGEDEQELFRLEFKAYDSLGHLGVKLELSSLDTGKRGMINRALLEFGVEPQVLTAFKDNLSQLMAK
jgi:hypothetical protein